MHHYDISFRNDPWNKSVQAVLWRLSPNYGGPNWVGYQNDEGDIFFKEHPYGHAIDQPTMSFSTETAQQLYDALHNFGYRPHGGRDSEGVHEAQKQHIDDLRKVIAWHHGEPK